MAERALATAFVNIVPGTKDLESYLKGKLGSDVASAGTGAGEGYSKSMAGGFGAKMKGAFAPIIGGLGLAFGAVGAVSFVKDMYGAAVEGQKVDAVLTNITGSMGLFGDGAGKVVSRLQDFATAQMKLTGVDDDVIKGTQAKLMTFKNLASTAGELGGMFDRTTTAAMDLAAAGFGSAEGNAVALGKALNDPVAGMASLGRMGVQFTDDQKKVIEGLVKTGDMAGAQKIIMGELETQVGGTAEASATAGEKMKARLDDAIQGIGTQLMPVFEGIVGIISEKVVPAFEGAIDGVKGFLGWFGENQSWLIPVMAGLGTVLLAIGVNIGIMNVAALIAGAGGLPAIIASTWAWTAALLANPITWIVLGIGLLIAGLVLLAMNWDKVVAWVSKVWSGFTSWLGKSFDDMGQWFASIGEAFGTVFGAVGDVVKGAFEGVVNFIKGYINTIINIINGVIDGINGVGSLLSDATGGAINFKIGHIPKLADGGYVTGPTTALIGEAGPEVVTPLKDFERMMGIDGAKGQTVNYYAAPNDSITSEQKLIDAMRRARVQGAF